MPILQKLSGRQILDSRGNPTLEVACFVKGVQKPFIAQVPSGASTGVHEAQEIRDGQRAFSGKGVLCAIGNVDIVSKALAGNDVIDQTDLDSAMIELDGAPDKSGLGANTLVGCSLALAVAGASSQHVALYEYIRRLSSKTSLRMPVPFFNVLNGGKHADNKVSVQEFMIAPVGARRFSDALKMGSEIYHELKHLIEKKYGKCSAGVGDEGGFAPQLATTREGLALLESAISRCGYKKQVRLALDVAASEFFSKGNYFFDGKRLSPGRFFDHITSLSKEFSLFSIEDPFHQEDFQSFANLKKEIGQKVQIVGDDLLVTNPQRIRMALHYDACSCLLLKVNQIGTLSEALGAAHLAQMYGWKVMVSHRSGETTDTFIADLAVGLGCGQIKAGAPCRGERVAKYNRLLEIEHELGKKARYGTH